MGAALRSWGREAAGAPGQSLPAIVGLFPEAARAVAMRKFGLFPAAGQRGGGSSGIVPALIKATPGSWKRLLETAPLGLRNGWEILVTSVLPVRNSEESQCISQSLFYAQGMILWCLCLCAVRKEPGSSLAGAAAD